MKIKPLDNNISREVQDYLDFIEYYTKTFYNEMYKMLRIPKKYFNDRNTNKKKIQ